MSGPSELVVTITRAELATIVEEAVARVLRSAPANDTTASPYLDNKALAIYIHKSEGYAPRWAKRHNLIDYGKGTGRGNLWKRSEVDAVLAKGAR